MINAAFAGIAQAMYMLCSWLTWRVFLKDAKPADLPVIQAAKCALAVDRKAAKKLGLTISRDFVERIDEVLE